MKDFPQDSLYKEALKAEYIPIVYSILNLIFIMNNPFFTKPLSPFGMSLQLWCHFSKKLLNSVRLTVDDCVDKIHLEHCILQLPDPRYKMILQAREQPSIQMAPKLTQRNQIIGVYVLHKLINNFVHLHNKQTID